MAGLLAAVNLYGCIFVRFFFFNDTATTEIYTLSLHDALPISRGVPVGVIWRRASSGGGFRKNSRSGVSAPSSQAAYMPIWCAAPSLTVCQPPSASPQTNAFCSCAYPSCDGSLPASRAPSSASESASLHVFELLRV